MSFKMAHFLSNTSTTSNNSTNISLKIVFFRANSIRCTKNNNGWRFQSLKSCWKKWYCILVSSTIISCWCFSVISDLLTINEFCMLFMHRKPCLNMTAFNWFLRLHLKFHNKNEQFFFGISEPISSTKPNVNIGDKTNIANIRLHHQISLLCPVQSYPIPAFR